MANKLTGWGLYPVSECEVQRPEKWRPLRVLPASAIARGLGRSYGDASLNALGTTILMERLNRFLSFDPKTGILCVESGVSLRDILQFTIPRGWFLKVTPGTTYATVGGCIAADVHGKNHHRDGSFCDHVLSFDLQLADGQRLTCSRTEYEALFWATAGGMGLTGIIVNATLQLQKIETSFIRTTHIATPDLSATMDILSDSAFDAPYSVAWIDCLATGAQFGRSIVMNGHHASLEDLTTTMRKDPLQPLKDPALSLPFHLPPFLLNTYSVRGFNRCFYSFQARKKQPFLSPLSSYFYPLDAINNWNKMYGKRGFVQYQFLIPTEHAREGVPVLLRELAHSGRGSFLAVLKRFGKQNPGLLSFPSEGFTLALDLPVTSSLFPFLDRLDALLLQFKGRLYLAKDARMRPETFRAMYPRLQDWLKIKREVDPRGVFSSDLSRRLHLEGGYKA